MSMLIPFQQAVDMTARFRKEKENILDPAFRNKDILVICETLNAPIRHCTGRIRLR
jgi:hypothetical protein